MYRKKIIMKILKKNFTSNRITEHKVTTSRSKSYLELLVHFFYLKFITNNNFYNFYNFRTISNEYTQNLAFENVCMHF